MIQHRKCYAKYERKTGDTKRGGMYCGERKTCSIERHTGKTGKLFLSIHKHKAELQASPITPKSRPWSPPYISQKYPLLRKTIKFKLNLRSLWQSSK